MPEPAARWAWPSLAGVAVLALSLVVTSGCTWISYLGTDDRGEQFGKLYYVGGAGTFGQIGTIDVPNGLRRAGYRGAIECFGWQSIIGGTLRDQLDRGRNEAQAQRLAERIMEYWRQHPGRRVDIIALSAGTGIATWALEMLPDDARIGSVVFLSSSLSREYDLRPALRRVNDKLYCFHSPNDPVLLYALTLAGSVDRETHGPDVAGLYGFAPPRGTDQAGLRLYAERLANRPHRSHYRQYGYYGLHTDSTKVDFVQHVLAPLMMRPLSRPVATGTAREPRAAPVSGSGRSPAAMTPQPQRTAPPTTPARTPRQ